MKISAGKKVNNFLEVAGGGLPLILANFVSVLRIPYQGFYPLRPTNGVLTMDLKTFLFFYLLQPPFLKISKKIAKSKVRFLKNLFTKTFL